MLRRALTALVVAGLLATAAGAEVDNPLLFLDRFIGDWGGDPESERARVAPATLADVAFRFEWLEPGKRMLRFVEAIPGGDLERRVLDTFVTFNPRTGEIAGVGYQLRNDFFYQTTFRPQEDGYVREYTVTYPPSQEFRDPVDRERGWIRYRDRCRLTAADRLHCLTEQLRAGEWQPWGGDREGYTLVRRPGGRPGS